MNGRGAGSADRAPSERETLSARFGALGAIGEARSSPGPPHYVACMAQSSAGGATDRPDSGAEPPHRAAIDRVH